MILSMRTLYPLKSLNMISTLAFKCIYIMLKLNIIPYAVFDFLRNNLNFRTSIDDIVISIALSYQRSTGQIILYISYVYSIYQPLIASSVLAGRHA